MTLPLTSTQKMTNVKVRRVFAHQLQSKRVSLFNGDTQINLAVLPKNNDPGNHDPIHKFGVVNDCLKS